MKTDRQVKFYSTPAGFTDIIIESDGDYITALRFMVSCAAEQDEQVHDTGEIKAHDTREAMFYDAVDVPVLTAASEWLDRYFAGDPPADLPPIKISGLTPFREEVLQILSKIPYGEVITYHDIAEQIALRRGLAHMSAQAVGQAVAWNPICIMIPCHRVIGSDGKLTGYSGGIDNKKLLLLHEQTL